LALTASEYRQNSKAEETESKLKDDLYKIKCFLLDYQEKLENLHSTKASPVIYSAKLMSEIVREEKEKQQHYDAINASILAMFDKVDINIRLVGARFLALCVCYSCAYPEYGVMRIYKLVADKCSTNKERVGRACRYACRTADLTKLHGAIRTDKRKFLDFNETNPTAQQVVRAFAMLIEDQFDFKKIV